MRIRSGGAAGKARRLPFARRRNERFRAGTRRRAPFPLPQFTHFHAPYIDLDVHAVQKRPGHLPLIFHDLVRGAGARALRVAVIAAWAWVHRRDKGKSRRECKGPLRARDADDARFHRFAERFERVRGKFRQFVEEEHAAVRQAHLARFRVGAASHERRRGRGLVRRAERPAFHQPSRTQPRRAPDLRHLDRFAPREVGQDARERSRKHALSDARRPDHKEVMPSRCGDRERAFRILLADDLGEIGKDTPMVRRGRAKFRL